MSDDDPDYGIGDHYGDSDDEDGDQATDAHDADHAGDHAGGDHAATGHAGGDHDDRVTSPMQSYTTTQVAWGAVVLAIGLLLTFGLGFAL